MKHLTIIGGGATGLAAAYIAAKRNIHVTIVEKSPNFGGLLQTFPIAGTHLEYFYHHFFTHDRHLRWLLKELNLENALKFYDGSIGILRNNLIYPFDGVFDLFKFSPLRAQDCIKFLLTSVFLGKMAAWEKRENISALEWFERYAGDNATENIWKPLLTSKFNRFAKDIPLAWMIGRLSQRMNSRKGSNQEQLAYIEGSLKVLLDHLTKSLKKLGVEMIHSCDTTSLDVKNQSLRGVETNAGRITSDDYLFTIPTNILSILFENHDPAFSSKLNRIYYLGALCVILELEKPLNPIYWINIADPDYAFTGVIEHTNLVPSSLYQNRHIVYLSRYFDPADDAIASLPENELKGRMIQDLQRMFPMFDTKEILNTFLFRSNTAATLCDLNFSKKVPPYQGPLKNMYVANMAHVYPDERSLNNSIRVASECLEHLR